MAFHRRALPKDLQELLAIIQSGRLFALQDWIKAGKRLRFIARSVLEDQVLRAAINTGFHSMVEELLRAGAWSAKELASCLELARSKRRYEIADLLLSHGAKPKQVDFQTCCAELDFTMMERHLRSGTDPNRDNDFAQALSRVKARPLLRFYREFHAEFPALDDQAALALSEAVQENQVRWTALLAWAGADPFRPVPCSLFDSFPVDPESCTNAAKEALRRNNPEILKALHLKPTAAQAVELLKQLPYNNKVELIRSLLAVIPHGQMNDTARGSCSALEHLVSKMTDATTWFNNSQPKDEINTSQCIEMLLDAGARWNPSPRGAPLRSQGPDETRWPVHRGSPAITPLHTWSCGYSPVAGAV